ncbi:hypothetical protein [Pseudoroseicyclus tamaricis]|uniref:Uncharacterized protein n=1 Tax=Pseudoroseicyclus tamaricis TaxID=2705421 RepID=A0A6B2JFV2_9RHOB|nr:hypothetical protein [Pseudoroseicyclus tamaricis]NDU99952.1 hypothetical protein [Pseudoroseicyclus tamaricis]
MAALAASPALAAGEDARAALAPAGAVETVGLFNTICVETQPDFRVAEVLLSDGPFVYQPADGIWYHQSLDLTVKLVDVRGRPGCSLVMGTAEHPRSALALLAATAAGGEVYAELIDEETNGRSYLRALVIGGGQ